MQIPLANKLKKRLHIDIASLQDEILDMLYDLNQSVVLHGGTSIWRCYTGNRFSEDLDIYAQFSDSMWVHLKKKLESRGLQLVKCKKTENAVYSKISDGKTEVRVEVNIKKQIAKIVRPYERIDGSFMSIFTLSAEDLLREKMAAFNSRRLIRDIYDVYHLSSNTIEKNAMKDFIVNLPEPIDEKTLKTLVYSGAVPSFRQMVEVLRARC